MVDDCLFCRMVRGEEKCHKIWEDDKHLAFLSNRPNTVGFSVVITKDHFPSYFVDLPDDVLWGLVLAARKVCQIIDNKFDDVGRTGMIFEGFGINHIHIKLFPMHGTKMDKWKPIKSNGEAVFFDKYNGYMSTHCGKMLSDFELKEIADIFVK